MLLKQLFVLIVIYLLNLNKMKEIDFLKADKQIRNLHKSEFSDSMIRDFNTEYFYMYTIGYNDAVKKHNAKRKKKNQTTTVNVPESDIQVVFKKLEEIKLILNLQECKISELFEKIEELKK